ncbi:hypothetical protein HYE82_03480 [Streptomyces sp. BR123]|uniref:DUF6233 domain-containing protein n=1 Tax=Streptomyces sp. BR123 TaxID=2749828 RepID=UPI0015C4BC68|nr:DUF6233 domain-containing protein [Streptomyces sp. BR123]NXY93483.1 hypothetical protein [Streptomyces sp. BR123]
MSDSSASRLDQLRFLEKVQVRDLERTRSWIADEEQRLAIVEARQPSAPSPDWLIEQGIGVGRRPVRVHVGGCWDASKRCHPATVDQARQALVGGVEACPHCRPDTELGVLD